MVLRLVKSPEYSIRTNAYLPVSETNSLAQQAIDHKLFVTGWLMLPLLLRLVRLKGNSERKGIPRYLISLAYCRSEHVFVGACIITNGTVMVYVDEKHRRKGIGTMLVDNLISFYPALSGALKHGKGIMGSELFFEKLAIEKEEELSCIHLR